MDRILLTVKGAEKLKVELKNLKSVQRPKIIAAIAEARAHGDLSENAEYHAAKEQQSFIEGRIRELEVVTSSAEIIDPSTLRAEGKVVFGSTVELYDVETEKEIKYQIVGDHEADLENAQISLGSPISRALIGKEEGDEVEVKAPGGIRRLEILKVHYI